MKNKGTIAALLEEAYRLQKRRYFEADFCSFVMERNEGNELCLIPSDTVADDKRLLDKAFEIFDDLEDCNVAFNDTMKETIAKVEAMIRAGEIVPIRPEEVMVDIIIDDDEIIAAYATDPNVRVNVTDLSSAFLSEEGKAEFWKNFDETGKYKIPVEMEHPSDME